jgi:hypothetical protein
MNSLKLAIVLCSFFLIFSCSKDNDLNGYSYYSESTIYSSTTTVQFREVLLTIKPYIVLENVKKFIVTDSLLNVKVKMNNTSWSTSNSLFLDTTSLADEVYGEFIITDSPIKYSIIARFEPTKDTLTTAGEYSDLLRNYMNIEPGVYFCRVESFEIKLADGSAKKVVPLISEMVEIKDSMRSLYLGDFEVEVK